MKPFKIIATGLSATMLATTMLAGAANAAPKPNIKFNTPMVAPKVNIIKPIRPNIARPTVQIRVNRNRLQPKAGQDDNQAGNAGAPAAQPRSKAVIAALIPPQRLPQPRPEFEKQADDIKDMIGADGIGDINPDDFRVGTNPQDPDGVLAGLGLPGYENPENGSGENNGPSGPAGGTPDGFGNVEPGIGGVGKPIGSNSHGKDAPGIAPGVRVTPESIASAAAGVSADGPVRLPIVKDTGGVRTEGPHQFGNGLVYTGKFRPDGTSTETTDLTQPDGAIDRVVNETHEDGSRTTSNIYIGPDGEAATGGEVPVNELHDPDYVEDGGYVPPNCGSSECNRERERQANPGLAVKEAQGKSTQVYPGPEGAADHGRNNGGEPIVSQHDLLSHYDPDFDQGAGGGIQNAPPRIQSD